MQSVSQSVQTCTPVGHYRSDVCSDEGILSQICHNVLFHLSDVCHAQVVKLEQKVKTLERENNMLRQIIKNIQNPGDRSVPDAP